MVEPELPPHIYKFIIDVAGNSSGCMALGTLGDSNLSVFGRNILTQNGHIFKKDLKSSSF